ncbi:hypothetical protein COO60DRAFT_1632464 [Scenedesmus sp. NREL 46B-D3]|nr:hypothetical protein COO60DRAFT_1632464 [Scenedesmus sp. NREL 46B-D3]
MQSIELKAIPARMIVMDYESTGQLAQKFVTGCYTCGRASGHVFGGSCDFTSRKLFTLLRGTNPEVSLVHHHLVAGALEELELQLADTPQGQRLLSYEEWRDEVAVQGLATAAAAAAVAADSRLDTATDGPHLLLLGKRVSAKQWQVWQQDVQQCLEQNDRWEDWQEGWPDAVQVWQHGKAVLASGQAIASTSSRSRSRDGAHFLVYYAEGEGLDEVWKPEVARATCYLRLLHPSGLVQRMALADFCSLQPVQEDPDLADLTLQGRKGKFNERSFPVLLDLIAGPLQVADRQVTRQRSNGRLSTSICRSYLPCHFRSGQPGKQVSRRHVGVSAAAAAAAAGAAAPGAAAGTAAPGTAAPGAAAPGQQGQEQGQR